MKRKYSKLSKKSRNHGVKPRARASLDIKRCYSCKDGRLIAHNELIFCGFCGKEFPRMRS